MVKGFNNFVLAHDGKEHDVKELDNRIGYDKLYITYRMYKMYKSVKSEKTWMERKLGLAKAREKFSEIIEQVQYQGESYVINRHGKPAAAVVPIEVYENWKQQRKTFFETIRKLQEGNQKFDPDQVWEDVIQAQISSRAPKE